MPLLVVLQDESGNPIEELEDPQNLLGKLLPSEDDTSFHALRYVDFYGDTIFNKFQMEPVLTELDRVLGYAETAEEVALLRQVQELARSCQDGTHLYLKFEGD